MIGEVIACTTTEQRQVLALAGFVHVTGLTTWEPMNDEKSVIGKDLPARWIGRYDTNNGMAVIVTSGGEIWLATMGKNSRDFFSSETVRALCPHGRGTNVPCSNGEWIHSSDLFKRLADPDCE